MESLLTTVPNLSYLYDEQNNITQNNIDDLAKNIDVLTLTVGNKLNTENTSQFVVESEPTAVPDINVVEPAPEVFPNINVDVQPVEQTPEIVINNNLDELNDTPDIMVDQPPIQLSNTVQTDLTPIKDNLQVDSKIPSTTFEPIEKILTSISSRVVALTSIDGEVKKINVSLSSLAADFVGKITPSIEKSLAKPLNDISDMPKTDTVKFADIDTLIDLQEQNNNAMMKVSAFPHSLRDDDARTNGKMYWPQEQIDYLKILLEKQDTIIGLLNTAIVMNGTPYEENYSNDNNDISMNDLQQSQLPSQPLTTSDLSSSSKPETTKEDSSKKPGLFGRMTQGIKNNLNATENGENKFGRRLDKFMNFIDIAQGKPVSWTAKRDRSRKNNRRL
jgi:hypothetical protein